MHINGDNIWTPLFLTIFEKKTRSNIYNVCLNKIREIKLEWKCGMYRRDNTPTKVQKTAKGNQCVFHTTR